MGKHSPIGSAKEILFISLPPPAVDGLATYEVRAGDSPFQIAKRHNMALVRFLHLNQLDPGSTIFPGQKVYIE